jgi:DNA-binding CsgD family transcriptional regulator
VDALPAEPGPREHEVRLLDAALEEVPEAIIVLDTSMRVVAWSRAASAVTGFPASAALGGICLFADGTLILDTEPGEVAARPPRPARRFWEFRVKDFGGPLEDVVAAVIPLGDPDLGAYIHLVPRPSGAAREVAGRGPTGRGVEALTPREREILRLLAAGKTAKPIAAELSLSVPTVRTHIQHILRKLGVHSCLEAAVVFLRTGQVGAMSLGSLMLGLLEMA